MEPNHNVVGWFEVPVTDMERAIAFYEAVFGFMITRNQMGPLDMGWFPWVDNGPEDKEGNRIALHSRN